MFFDKTMRRKAYIGIQRVDVSLGPKSCANSVWDPELIAATRAEAYIDGECPSDTILLACPSIGRLALLFPYLVDRIYIISRGKILGHLQTLVRFLSPLFDRANCVAVRVQA